MIKNDIASENLIKYLGIYSIASVTILIFVLWFKIANADLFSRNFCSSAECIETFFSAFKGMPELIEFLIKALVSWVTIYVVYHALRHYLNSISTSRSNLYLMHLNTFNTFLSSEIENYSRLDIKSFDVFKWYNLAYPDARFGVLEVGTDYKDFISSLNKEIKKSNDIEGGVSAAVGRFDYRDHQSRVIRSVKAIGAKMPRSPRNDFYEIEGDMFSLINKINNEFCFLDRDENLYKRKYV
ncbi:MAG: retron Ec48 family effector membrane protein [Colwellia sp.]|jgi:hypothetical protein